jgi:hypothetical protein
MNMPIGESKDEPPMLKTQQPVQHPIKMKQVDKPDNIPSFARITSMRRRVPDNLTRANVTPMMSQVFNRGEALAMGKRGKATNANDRHHCCHGRREKDLTVCGPEYLR